MIRRLMPLPSAACSLYLARMLASHLAKRGGEICLRNLGLGLQMLPFFFLFFFFLISHHENQPCPVVFILCPLTLFPPNANTPHPPSTHACLSKLVKIFFLKLKVFDLVRLVVLAAALLNEAKFKKIRPRQHLKK